RRAPDGDRRRRPDAHVRVRRGRGARDRAGRASAGGRGARDQCRLGRGSLDPRPGRADGPDLRLAVPRDPGAAGGGLRTGLRGHPAARAGGAPHARDPRRAGRHPARRRAQADHRVVQTTVALRVDVDTRRGLTEGVPRLLELFRLAGVRASFFVTMGPDRSGRAIRRALRPSFLLKMWRTNALRLYGFRSARDTRGDAVFRPSVGGVDLATVQVPTTMPTMDELLGRVRDLPGALVGALRPGLNVFTLHAEVEGGPLAPAFERFLAELR